MAYDVVDLLCLALPLATVLIKRREDNFSRFAFAGIMFRLNAATPVVLPAFVRFTSSGRMFAKCARVSPFPEANKVAFAVPGAVSAAAPLAKLGGEV